MQQSRADNDSYDVMIIPGSLKAGPDGREPGAQLRANLEQNSLRTRNAGPSGFPGSRRESSIHFARRLRPPHARLSSALPSFIGTLISSLSSLG